MGQDAETSEKTEQLKDILWNKKPLSDFGQWMHSVNDLLAKKSLSFNDYLKSCDFTRDDEELITQFFRYCFNYGRKGDDESLKTEMGEIFDSNLLGPICFVTPEVGRWTTVGGLGVMVDELTEGLAHLGQKVIVICPYYQENSKGKTDYLANDPLGIQYIGNISITLDGNYSFGVHHGTGKKGIEYYFLHNSEIFPRPYPDLDSAATVREIACFAKAALQVLCDYNIVPSLVCTNDWFTGLVPAYGKNGAFGDTFKGTKFFHICHNLETSYEGRVFPTEEEGDLGGIYQFDTELVIDPTWEKRIVNPSRCAIIMSDQWGTVSKSYKEDLLNNSPLNFFLKQKPCPFGCSNGIDMDRRYNKFKEFCQGGRQGCKREIQQKYFGFDNADYSIPLYTFVGRLTEQKGVELLLDAAEEIINMTNGRINILIGGSGSPKDPYFQRCVDKIKYLRGKFPNSFWADPDAFFTDGAKVNMGSDFALMPSLFEPGGLVQHEFFIAGTPVIAFKTGGLKDTVFDFYGNEATGNGITFDNHCREDLIDAVKRSLELFNNKEKYEKCSKNATQSVIDISSTSREWCREFYRLYNKIYFNVREAKQPIEKIWEYTNQDWKYYIWIHRDQCDGEQTPVSFTFKNECGNSNDCSIGTSLNNWQDNYKMSYDSKENVWYVTIKFPKGRHLYKFCIDGKWVIHPYEELFAEGDIVNNVLNI